MYKNVKIAITDEVQLKAVCDVLESMGYKIIDTFKKQKWVYATESKSIWFANIDIYSGELNTIADLLALRDKHFMEQPNAAS